MDSFDTATVEQVVIKTFFVMIAKNQEPNKNINIKDGGLVV